MSRERPRALLDARPPGGTRAGRVASGPHSRGRGFSRTNMDQAGARRANHGEGFHRPMRGREGIPSGDVPATVAGRQSGRAGYQPRQGGPFTAAEYRRSRAARSRFSRRRTSPFPATQNGPNGPRAPRGEAERGPANHQDEADGGPQERGQRQDDFRREVGEEHTGGLPRRRPARSQDRAIERNATGAEEFERVSRVRRPGAEPSPRPSFLSPGGGPLESSKVSQSMGIIVPDGPSIGKGQPRSAVSSWVIWLAHSH
jgi:hypothetical protein